MRFFKDTREEFIENVANKVVKLADQLSISLTDALEKVAREEQLSIAEIENVCASANQIKFAKEFSVNKLASFERANYEEVIRRLTQKEYEKVAKEKGNKGDIVIKAEPIKQFQPFNQPMRKIASYDEKKAKEILYKGTREMLDGIYKLRENIDKIAEHVYNDVIEISNRYGMTGKDVATKLFTKLSQLLPMKSAVLLTDAAYRNRTGLRLNRLDLEKTADADSIDVDDLDLLIKTGMLISHALANAEYAYLFGKNMIKKAGWDASEFERNEPDEFITSEYEGQNMLKLASIFEWLGRVFKKNAPELAVNAKDVVTSVPDNLKHELSKVLKASLLSAMALPPAALMGAALNYTDDVVLDMKRKKLMKELPKRFPELKEIPYKTYYNIYESLTGLNPALIKAPMALAEAIKKIYTYGTIDIQTVTSLLKVNKRDKLYRPQLTTDFLVRQIEEHRPGTLQELQIANMRHQLEKQGPELERLKQQNRIKPSDIIKGVKNVYDIVGKTKVFVNNVDDLYDAYNNIKNRTKETINKNRKSRNTRRSNPNRHGDNNTDVGFYL